MKGKGWVALAVILLPLFAHAEGEKHAKDSTQKHTKKKPSEHKEHKQAASEHNSEHQEHEEVSDEEIAKERATLLKNTKDHGFGPQSPRDLNSRSGKNPLIFNYAPPYEKMNLCNIHIHKNAEHKGGEFTTYAGNGNGHGFGTGYKYSGHLSSSERVPATKEICPSEHGSLAVGDTIEIHYVHSTADVQPGPTLDACLHESVKNPELRVETQVAVLVNDRSALNFGWLAQHSFRHGYFQALHIPENTGMPIQYTGSTTGPAYNEQGSPFQVTWSVRPKIVKVHIDTVGDWCRSNTFKENHAHGVRTLVTAPSLLSEIK